jgi:integrase/recombinase XerC
MLLSEGILLFLEYCKNQRKFTDKTIQTYSIALKQFFNLLTSELETEPQINEITKDHIKRFASYIFYQKLSKKSIKLKLSSIKSFFKFLYRKEYISEDPSYSISLPKIEKNIPSFLVPEEIEQILTHLKPDNTINARNLALIELLYSTGLRISEALSLKVSDVADFQKTIKVLGKGKKERIVPIGTKAREAIKTYFKFRQTLVNENSQNMLFLSKSGKPLTSTDAYRIINSLLKQYSQTPQKSPHTLRHTFATHMLNNGADIRSVSEMLGHSSLSSTQIYTHVSIQKIKEEYKKAHPKA